MPRVGEEELLGRFWLSRVLDVGVRDKFRIFPRFQA